MQTEKTLESLDEVFVHRKYVTSIYRDHPPEVRKNLAHTIFELMREEECLKELSREEVKRKLKNDW